MSVFKSRFVKKAFGLSQLSPLESNLLRSKRRRRTGRIGEPVLEIAIKKEVHGQQCGEIGKRPVSLAQVVEPTQQQQCDQRRPDLDKKGVFRGTDEGFDLQVLFEGFEEDLNLPALTVDVGNSGSAKVEMVGQKDNRFLQFIIPNDDAAKRERTLPSALGAG